MPGEDLERIAVRAAADGIEVRGSSTLKTAPRGFSADHPRIGLLRYKGLVAWKQWPVEPWLGTAGTRQRVEAFLRASQPLAGWLARHVGPAS